MLKTIFGTVNKHTKFHANIFIHKYTFNFLYIVPLPLYLSFLAYVYNI